MIYYKGGDKRWVWVYCPVCFKKYKRMTKKTSRSMLPQDIPDVKPYRSTTCSKECRRKLIKTLAIYGRNKKKHGTTKNKKY